MTKASLAQGKQILDLLSSASSEQAQELISSGDLLQQLLATSNLRAVDRAAFARFLAKYTAIMPELFRDPFEIYDVFNDRSRERGWPFDNRHLHFLRSSVPRRWVSSLNRVCVLEIWLGDAATTTRELWEWVVSTFGAEHTHCSLDFTAVDSIANHSFKNKPFVRWASVDLLTQRNQRFDASVAPSAGLSALAAAAIHPDWTRTIDHDTVPGVVLPGLFCDTRWSVRQTLNLSRNVSASMISLSSSSEEITSDRFVLPGYVRL